MMSAIASPAAEPAGGSGGGGGAPSMRAAVLRQHGEPPRFGQHPVPSRRPGQALIRVTAAPVNPLDLLCASGTSYFGAPALPYVPGTQGVGTVAEADGAPAGPRDWFSCSAGLAACRDPHGRARASELGADAVADLSGEEVDAVAEQLARAVGDRVDLVLDPVWGVPAEAALRVLSPNGRLVNLGSSAGAMAGFSSA